MLFLCKYGILPMIAERRKVPIVFFHSYKNLPFPRNRLLAMVKKFYTREKIPKRQEVHLILCSDYFIKKLNGKFRNKPYPTDVLSFNYDEKNLLGEIYISLQRAKIQAKRYQETYADEIERLFVHGMVHLLGYDHEKPEDRKRMEAKEKKYRL
jgi:probable rRNA maturation factor